VFKVKRDEHGAVVRHKAWLVVKWYAQRHGIDYDEVFAPVACMEAVRLLLALAAHEGWQVHHMDVKMTFLNGDLQEEVYVQQAPGFAQPGQEHKVYRLHKALYGLHQAPRAWNRKLDEKYFHRFCTSFEEQFHPFANGFIFHQIIDAWGSHPDGKRISRPSRRHQQNCHTSPNITSRSVKKHGPSTNK